MIRYLKALILLSATLALVACGGGGGDDDGYNCSFIGGSGVASLNVSVTAEQSATITPFSIAPIKECSIRYSASGALPAGLSLNADTSVISGTTVASPGQYSFTVIASLSSNSGGNGGSSSRSVNVTVTRALIAPSAWSVTNARSSLPTATIGKTNLLTVGGNLYALLSVNQSGNYVPQLWKSTDAGSTWANTNLNVPTPTGNLYGFSAATDGVNIIVVGGINTRLAATTGLFHSNAVYSIAPNMTTPAWDTKTTAAFALPFGRAYAGIAHDAGVFYVYGGRGSSTSYDVGYKSMDGGATWQQNLRGNTLSIPSLDSHCLLVNGSNMLLIGGSRVVRTSNGTTVSGPTITPSDSVYKSTDSGVTWVKTASAIPANPVDVACISNDSKVVVTGGLTGSSASRTIYRSSDFGSTWDEETQNRSIPRRSSHGLSLLGPNMITVGGIGDGSVRLSDVLTAPF